MKLVVLSALVLVLVLSFSSAAAAVSVSRAELSAGSLRVEGSGAVANATVTVNGGASLASALADSGGRFKVTASGYSSPSCQASVSDGSTSRTVTLSGCTASQPPPPAGPAAPTLVGPANGAALVQPITLSWSQVTDPAGAVIVYNWEVSASATFASVIAGGQTVYAAAGLPPPAQDQLSGLPNGAYFWRVNSVALRPPPQSLATGPWSAARGVTVTGLGPAPASPAFLSPANGALFHPFEPFLINWTTVSGAVSYRYEVDQEPTFSAPGFDFTETTGTQRFNNWGETIGPLYYRVIAIGATGVRSLPSAVRSYTISYAAPIPPAPASVAPADGASTPLPVTLDWTDVANSAGYEVQISTNSAFTGGCGTIELCSSPNASQYSFANTSNPAGVRYWRVRSYHGAASPTAGAYTGWSAVRSFVIPATPLTISSFRIYSHSSGLPTVSTTYSGNGVADFLVRGAVQLTGPAPAGGVVVNIVSSVPGAVSLPATALVPAGESGVAFAIISNEVTTPVSLTITVSIGGAAASQPLTVLPTQLGRVDIGVGIGGAQHLSGGSSVTTTVLFLGVAPSAGATVFLSADSASVSFPATISAGAGVPSVSFTLNSSIVTVDTTVTLTASYNGQSASAVIVLHPPPVLTSPASGATFTTGQAVIFDWPSANWGVNSYTIQVDESSAFTAPLLREQSTTVSEYTTSTLPGGTLFWRVRQHDMYGQPGPWSAVRSITVSAPSGPLAAPVLRFPTNGGRVNLGQAVSFFWDEVVGAASYELQVDNSSAFSVPLTLNPTVGSSRQYDTSTLAAGEYWWRVRARDSAGNPGAWSVVRTLEVR